MSYLKYLMLAFFITAIIGCNDDIFSKKNGIEILEEGGSVTFRISLPIADSNTRVTTIDDLADGTANEFNVESAVIFLFDESQNLIVSKSLTGTELGFKTIDTPNNITSQSTTLILNKGSVIPKYILVFLNAPNALSNSIGVPQTFADIQKAVNDTSAITKDGYFFMSNSTFDYSNISPVYNSSLSGIQSLQEIDSNSLSYGEDPVVDSTELLWLLQAKMELLAQCQL